MACRSVRFTIRNLVRRFSTFDVGGVSVRQLLRRYRRRRFCYCKSETHTIVCSATCFFSKKKVFSVRRCYVIRNTYVTIFINSLAGVRFSMFSAGGMSVGYPVGIGGRASTLRAHALAVQRRWGWGGGVEGVMHGCLDADFWGPIYIYPKLEKC